MNNNRVGEFVICYITGALLGFVLGTLWVNWHATHRMQVQAVEAGVAEWVIIDAKGKAEFRWNGGEHE